MYCSEFQINDKFNSIQTIHFINHKFNSIQTNFINDKFKYSFIHSSELQQWLIHSNMLCTSPIPIFIPIRFVPAPSHQGHRRRQRLLYRIRCRQRAPRPPPRRRGGRHERDHDPVIRRRTTTGITLIPFFIIDQAALTALPLRHDTAHSSTYLPEH